MRILVDQVTESPKSLRFAEGMEELNRVEGDRSLHEFRFPPSVDVNLVFYRCGRDILFRGSLQGVIGGCCSRCLEPYSFGVEKNFEFVLVPELTETDRKKELNKEEMEISFYQGAEINLAPLIREQVLLALPIRPLCTENCRGLCAGCGVNLNEESCLCSAPEADERLGVFRSLRLNR